MNKSYRLVWRASSAEWVVAAETSRGRTKKSTRAVAAAGVLATALSAPSVVAAPPPPPAPTTLPTGGQVVAGQATIATAGATMNIQQSTDKAILNWQSFSIGSGAAVNFQQPSTSSVALNRVLGQDPSAIYGSLTANGQVFLVNPNGVLFAPGARVDVGGLVASTMDIRNEDFLGGTYRFLRNGSTGSVINQGSIVARYAALLAPEVRNEGVIAARMGTVALAAGEAVTLGITGERLVDVQVDKATIDTLVENRNLVKVDAGTVVMSAQSVNTLLGKVVNSGAVEANGIVADGGTVRLTASSNIDLGGSISADAGANGRGGTIVAIADLGNAASRTDVTGGLSAKGGTQSGDGGFIETSASKLKVANTARVDTSAANGRTGSWLLDPTDFTVAATGGDIDGATLAGLLGSNNVTIQTGTGTDTATDRFGASGTNGDVFVNDTVSWSANTLTLKAHRDVNVNAAMTVTGSGGLAVQYGQGAAESGNDALFTANKPVNLNTTGAFTTKLGSDGSTKTYTIVNSFSQLQAIDTDGTSVQGNYALGSNITITSGLWTPIGNAVGPFQGIFDGLGHTISGLTNAAAVTENVGFIGQTSNDARVQNVRVDVAFTGRLAVGGLVGINSGKIYNAFSTGTVGLDSAIGTASAPENVVRGIGGLVGQSNGEILRSRSSVTVSADGGSQSFDASPVPVGAQDGAIGGLVGYANGGKISNSYATGDVTGIAAVGGLVGHMAATVEKSYSTGKVTGTSQTGGLAGFAPAGIVATDSYWDTDTSLKATSAGGANGLTTANLKLASSIDASWDRTRFWKIADGSYPGFQTGPAAAPTVSAISITLGDFTRVYGTNPDSGNLSGFSFTGTLLDTDALTGVSWGTAYTARLSVGDYSYQSTANLLSPQFTFSGTNSSSNYNVSYSANKLTITPKALTVSDLVVPSSKVYDGTTVASASRTPTGTPLPGGGLATVAVGSSIPTDGKALEGDDVSLTSPFDTLTAAYNSKDVGVGTLVTVNGVLTGAQAGNYKVTAAATITPKALTVTGLSGPVSKVYDATTAMSAVSGTAVLQASEAPGTGSTSDGKPYDGDTVTLTGTATGTYNSKDVATATTVTFGGLNPNNNNYTITGTMAATITPKELNNNSANTNFIQPVTKVYDGTTVASVARGPVPSGGPRTVAVGAGNANDHSVYEGDDVSFIVSGALGGTYDSKDVATASRVTVSGMLSGAQAGNYKVVVDGTITPKALTVTGLFASSKVYDGTTSAVVAGAAVLQGAQDPGTGTTSDGKPYTGDIVSAVGAVTPVGYDFKDVATATKVNFTGLTSSNDNYTISGSQAATITKATVGLSANKVYDGNTALTGTQVTITGVNGESLSSSSATANSKDVGAGNFISAITLANGTTGTIGNAGNYQAPAVLDATSAPVTISKATAGLSATKVYDGTTGLSSTQVTVTGVNGESLSSSSATANSKDVGAGNFISAITLANGTTGTIGNTNNYQAPTVLDATSAPVTINKATVGLSATKVYDGSTALTGTQVTVTGVNGESLSYSAATANSKDVGAGNFINAIALANGTTGTIGNANNYKAPTVLDATSAPVTIDKATVGLSATKVYDGSTALTGTQVTVTGVNGESLSVSSAFANSKDVGTGNFIHTIALANGTTGTIGNANNYKAPTVLDATSAPVTINKANLILVGERVYDATAIVSGGSLTAKGVGSDVFLLNGVGEVASKNVVTDTPLTNLGTLSIAGPLCCGSAPRQGNYNLSTTGSKFTITPKALSAIDLGEVGVRSADPSRPSIGETLFSGQSVSLTVDSAPKLLSSAPGAGTSGDGKVYTGDALDLNISTGTVTGLAGTEGKQNIYSVSVPFASAFSGADVSNYTVTGSSVSAKVRASVAAVSFQIPLGVAVSTISLTLPQSNMPISTVEAVTKALGGKSNASISGKDLIDAIQKMNRVDVDLVGLSSLGGQSKVSVAFEKLENSLSLGGVTLTPDQSKALYGFLGGVVGGNDPVVIPDVVPIQAQ